MEPQAQTDSQHIVQSNRQAPEEPSVRHVEDRALPALQILTEQRRATVSDLEIRLFIP